MVVGVVCKYIRIYIFIAYEEPLLIEWGEN
jgi:hypothetical protein